MSKVAYSRSKGGTVSVTDADEIRYHEPSWQTFHQLGKGPGIAHRAAHLSLKFGDTIYDARMIPPFAESELAALDAAVRAAHIAKMTWLAEQFRTWPLAAGNVTVVPARCTEAEAKAWLKAQPKPDVAKTAAERKMLQSLNRALR